MTVRTSQTASTLQSYIQVGLQTQLTQIACVHVPNIMANNLAHGIYAPFSTEVKLSNSTSVCMQTCKLLTFSCCCLHSFAQCQERIPLTNNSVCRMQA